VNARRKEQQELAVSFIKDIWHENTLAPHNSKRNSLQHVFFITLRCPRRCVVLIYYILAFIYAEILYSASAASFTVNMSRVLLSSSRLMRLCRNVEKTPASFQQARFLTNQDALRVLNLGHVRLTPTALRTAYLEAAKQCHPDTLQNPEKSKQEAAQQFQLVTEAYEVLLGTKLASDEVNDYGITVEEDAAFRRACQERLGLPAEIVEESKQCPAFRQWLSGKTDAAHHWRIFFIQHGGLAPKLRPPAAGLLESNLIVKKSATRRRRPSQSTNL